MTNDAATQAAQGVSGKSAHQVLSSAVLDLKGSHPADRTGLYPSQLSEEPGIAQVESGRHGGPKGDADAQQGFTTATHLHAGEDVHVSATSGGFFREAGDSLFGHPLAAAAGPRHAVSQDMPHNHLEADTAGSGSPTFTEAVANLKSVSSQVVFLLSPCTCHLDAASMNLIP
jgi:hypothetical protein